MEKEIKKSTIAKTKKVDVETRKGGKYSYRYTELADINDYIDSIGERYYQIIQKVDGDEYIFTKRIGENAPKELLQGCKILTAPVSSEYSNPAQEQGSALTYARRYSLLMAYGLATEDDDAQSLSKPKIATKEEAEKIVINFGTKHNGETLKEINENDKNYVQWLAENSRDETIKQASSLILEDAGKLPNVKLLTEFQELLIRTESDLPSILEFYKVKDSTELNDSQLTQAIAHMSKKIKPEEMK